MGGRFSGRVGIEKGGHPPSAADHSAGHLGPVCRFFRHPVITTRFNIKVMKG
uniref:Uncharacterized 5.4 kDa protein in replication origin region n=1 Tax=Escherichia coli TaxID=562 RepID=YP54_ECOLX|nr:RecName: Full=Uncharacterized 5.4 kDa protein in replication origin region; AltName: Full=ORF2 [Escherichia coli]pir/T08488/ hypothetical protein 2 - Enterobacter aerogenes plasmid R751 [Klebsiella aerogenes]AAC64432.1 unidentified orf2 [Klebsiella aerogenes]CAA25887.1 unnamed protein product [Pseudomonas aeruginosa]